MNTRARMVVCNPQTPDPVHKRLLLDLILSDGSSAMTEVMKLSQILILLLLGLSVIICSVHANTDDDDARLVMVMSQMHPPKRPEHFRNMDELNVYLDKLRQYYTILGRPRSPCSTTPFCDSPRGNQVQ
ncbi:hypothetical protein CAPTEDRAFT_224912 [Capitella teleta]|uniref:Uncharacterized protein n=1 Tax=Capitella teleta TaxID=283909 RepID=R7VGB1_CAPTE|nr:hypothetical protein CAPTEDRAFT_224912 [Capitella teleta]|eukprot:ELU14705.1 hypothetical protein CAPTEDRAFT_224912 [Capitella teleta]